jgi:hypothetical protein
MKLETALMRLMQDPTKMIRRTGWDDSQPSLVVEANVKEPAPSRDTLRWNSILYTVRGKKADLQVRDIIFADWTVLK